MDEGYIKYICHWEKEAIKVPFQILEELNFFRAKLIRMGMIGKIPNGPGFGNISVRTTEKQFLITGSNTGHISVLTHKEIARVEKTDIEKNSVYCKGIIQASSESMSHSAIYNSQPSVNAVIHIHHEPLWNTYKNILPTTSKKIAYGTPEMAFAIKEKIAQNPHAKVLVLEGHKDGLFSYGPNLKAAFEGIENLF